MAGKRFNLIFEGKVEAGHSRDQVGHMFQQMFKFDSNEQDQLFSGRPVVLGESMDVATANTFKLALAAAGAVTRLVEASDKAADAMKQRRSADRRIFAQRRSRMRTEAILPDRRKSRDRRR